MKKKSVLMELNRNCYSVSRIFDETYMAEKQFIVAVEGAGAIGTFRRRVGSNYTDSKSHGPSLKLIRQNRTLLLAMRSCHWWSLKCRVPTVIACFKEVAGQET